MSEAPISLQTLVAEDSLTTAKPVTNTLLREGIRLAKAVDQYYGTLEPPRNGIGTIMLGSVSNELDGHAAPRRRSPLSPSEEPSQVRASIGLIPWSTRECHQDLGKGARAVVISRLRMRSWETDEGDKRSAVEVEADEVALSLKCAPASVERSGAKATAGASDSTRRAAGGQQPVFVTTEEPVG